MKWRLRDGRELTFEVVHVVHVNLTATRRSLRRSEEMESVT